MCPETSSEGMRAAQQLQVRIVRFFYEMRAAASAGEEQTLKPR